MVFSHRGSITHIRQRIRDIVHNHRYQIAVIILVLLDAAIVVATIIVDDASGKSNYYQNFHVACSKLVCPKFISIASCDLEEK